MDDYIKSLARGMIERLDELQSTAEFTHLLNCSEKDLKDEASRLHKELNDLKYQLEKINIA
jgi:hypothetical protein